MSKKLRYLVYLSILSIGILLGVQIEQAISGDDITEQLRKFNEILSITKKNYVDDVDTQKLVESAINGMLSELDPHSVYIPPKQFEQVEEEFRGNFEGIGVEFQILNDTIIVVSPITGGPSEALGIQSGDRIVKIDGEGYSKITNEQVFKKLRGPKGTKVVVSIFRHGIDGLLDFTIIRDKIPLNSVDTYFMYDDQTAYLSLSKFISTSYDEVYRALSELKSKGMKRLIFDLRNNPGGLMDESVKISDLFLPGDKLIVYTKSRFAKFEREFYTEETSDFENLPVIILVNQGSASASEIVSGAIQDWDRGLIVGQTTFGKGLVQNQFTLSDNSALRLTTSRYYTPIGRLIQRDYKKGKLEDYYMKSMQGDSTEGENVDHSLENDTTKKIYYTKGNRKVYGGGGITPDYIIKSQSLTKFTSQILRNNLFYTFVLAYLDKEGKSIISKYPTLNEFRKNYEISNDFIDEFIEYTKEKKITFNEEEFKKDKSYIAARLKAQIGRNFWKNEIWYMVLLEEDQQFMKTLTLFPELKKLNVKK